MGRAIVREPRVFLMDEPLSNLDAKLRVATRAEIAALQRRLGVDDDLRHARPGRGDDDGRPRRRDARTACSSSATRPRRSTTQPVNAFVAGFIGSPAMNMFNATVEDGGVSIGGSTLEVPGGVPLPSGSPVSVGLRPEALELSTSGGIQPSSTSSRSSAPKHIVYVELAETPGGVDAGRKVIVRVPPNQAPPKGAAVQLAPKPGSMLFFDAESGERIVA